MGEAPGGKAGTMQDDSGEDQDNKANDNAIRGRPQIKWKKAEASKAHGRMDEAERTASGRQ